MIKTITRNAIQEHLKNNDDIFLIEALPERYYNDMHLPKAIQINFDEMDDKIQQLPKNTQTKIIVYCSNLACANSGKAVIKLEQMGYNNVYKYAEGKQDWIEAHLPTETAA